MLGNPPLAEQRFATAGEAVRWLKEEALSQFPDAEFHAQCLNGDDGGQILDHLCACKIAGSISWTWDGGFYGVIGELKLADTWSAASAGEALDWLRDQALRL